MFVEFLKSLIHPALKPAEWKEGSEAYYAGSSEKSNPYLVDSMRYNRWLDGYYGR